MKPQTGNLPNSALPSFRIEREVLVKILMYAQECDREISGFGMMGSDGAIRSLVPLLEQVCSGAETEITEKAMHELTLSKYSGKIRLWWHSHAHMNCFWSTTDEAAIEVLGRGIDLLYSVVVNKNNEYLARIDLFRPLRFTWHALKLDIVEAPNSKLRERVRLEIEEKVKLPLPMKPASLIPVSQTKLPFFPDDSERIFPWEVE